MSTDGTSRPDLDLVDRLGAAIDRLELALDRYAEELREADASAAIVDAMTRDRAALAAELDAERARSAALRRAAETGEAEVTDAAAAVAAAFADAAADASDGNGDSGGTDRG